MLTAISSPPPDTGPSENLSFKASDGYPLAATLFRPSGPVRSAVLVNSATAVPRKIYRGFASYLAERGCAVLTYDYRGTGNSRPESLVGFKASMADWAALDVTAAVAWMRSQFPMPLRYVGHSFGGQALGLLPNNTEVSRGLLVAAQAGYWGLMTPPEGYRVYALMNFIGKPLTQFMGYASGNKMGIGEDLPKDVYLQWARWVMSRRYYYDDPSLAALANYPNYRGAVRALSFSDDPWATPPAVEVLCSGFTSTKPEILTITPASVGATKIGHLGFFRREHRNSLWKDAADWLLPD